MAGRRLFATGRNAIVQDNMITLRQLHVFIEVVRAGSFRRCGERMGMSQVSVSEHVRALEGRWGVTLFDRRPGTMSVLTDAGRSAYERASVILADVADLDRELTKSQRGEKRQIPVALHTYMMRDLPPVIAQFERRHDVSVTTDMGLCFPHQLADRVGRRELDLAYFFALAEADAPGSRLVGGEELGVFVGAGHPFAQRSVVKLAELADEPSAQLTRRDPLNDLVSRAFSAIGLRDRKIGIETDDFGLVINFVMRGHGYACLFASMGDEPGLAMPLVRVTLDTPLPPLQIRLLARRASAGDAVLTSFIDEVTAKFDRPD